jgi:hypothetical protein
VSLLHRTNTGEGNSTVLYSSGSNRFRSTSATSLFVFTDFVDKDCNNRNIEK